MSMIGCYRRITYTELTALQQSPGSIRVFLYQKKIPAHQADRELSIDKAWHAIHFLLTGDRWAGAVPLRNAVLGGTPLGNFDVGYGPARFLTPDEVKKVAAALSEISPDELQARCDFSVMTEADIYPSSWEDAEEELEYIYSTTLLSSLSLMGQHKKAMPCCSISTRVGNIRGWPPSGLVRGLAGGQMIFLTGSCYSARRIGA